MLASAIQRYRDLIAGYPVMARRIWPLTAILVLIFLARVRYMPLEMHGDEVWSLWNTSGSLQQTIQWTPYDWNPLYFLVLNLWRGLVGDSFFAARVGSLLIGLVSAALVFAIARRLSSYRAALLALLAYGALGYYAYITLEVRAYSLLVLLLLLVIALTLHYFQRPVFRRAVPLALAIVACFAIQATVAIPFVLIGLVTLILYGKRSWHWWLPILLALPLTLLLLGQGDETAARLQHYNTGAWLPLDTYVTSLFTFHTGSLPLLWAGVGLLAVIGLARTHRWRLVAAWGAWLVGGMVIFYLLLPVFNTGVSRHSWWLPIGFILLVGWGLAELPRLVRLGAGGVLVLLLFAPLTVDRYYHQPFANPPLGEQMQQLTQQAQWGDVLVLDARQICSPRANEWLYYTQQYFPQGLTILAAVPTSARRVWFVSSNGWQDAALEASIQQQRVRSTFFGPPDCLFQLYEAPPLAEPIRYENGLAFHGAEEIENGSPQPIHPIVRHEGDTLHLRVWWSVRQPLPQDYSIGVIVREQESGEILLQQDGAPQLARLFLYDETPLPAETSRWQPDQFYIQDVQLRLPEQMKTSFSGIVDYQVCLTVYYWETLERQTFAGADSERCLPLATFQVSAW